MGLRGRWGRSILVDQVSVFFIILTVSIILLSFLSMVMGGSRLSIGSIGGGSLALCFLSLGIFLIRVFCLSSRLIFFLCFELCVVPIFLLISEWGAQVDRVFSSYYFLFYSIVTPAPLLLGLLKLSSVGHRYFRAVTLLDGTVSLGILEVRALVLRFFTKLPLYRLHI